MTGLTVLLTAEGVLMDDWKARDDGRILLAALGGVYRVVVALDTSEVERFEVWAKMEKIKGYAEIMPGLIPVALRGCNPRVAQLENLIGRGYGVAFLVDPDPSNVAEALTIGVNGLLYAHAKYQAPEFRPDFGGRVRPWDDIVAELDTQRYLASQHEDSGDDE